jgi:hypothetical protein
MSVERHAAYSKEDRTITLSAHRGLPSLAATIGGARPRRISRTAHLLQSTCERPEYCRTSAPPRCTTPPLYQAFTVRRMCQMATSGADYSERRKAEVPRTLMLGDPGGRVNERLGGGTSSVLSNGSRVVSPLAPSLALGFSLLPFPLLSFSSGRHHNEPVRPYEHDQNNSSMMANFTYCASKVFGPNSVRRVPENPTTIAMAPVVESVLMIMAPSSSSLPTRLRSLSW